MAYQGGYPGQTPYGAPPPGQQPYGAPPGQQPYGAPPAQQPYGAPPPGQPAYGAPPPGQPAYGAPPPGQPAYGAPPPGQPAYGAPPGHGAAPGGYPGAAPGGYPGAAPGGYPGQPGAPVAGGCPPGVDPTVFTWFQSVDTDRSGQITAIELQQALTNGNWSHFNAETCRLMIGMFDKDQSGTINIQEFGSLWQYIQQWKGVFERYDRDRSGAIEANELSQALNEMGFRVSMTLVMLICSRYDIQAKRSLKLDDFIQVCVLIRSLTDAFRQRDTNMSGSINVSYEDFMCMVLLNKP